MRINEVLLEFDVPESLKDVEIANVFGKSITAGDISNALPGIDPKTVIEYGKDINDALQTNIANGYTVSDALLDAATLIPAVRAARLLRVAKSPAAVASLIGRRELAKEIGKNVSLNPALTKKASASAGGGEATPVEKKSRKYNVGDRVPVPVDGKVYKLPIVAVLPTGYEVHLGEVPGKQPNETMSISEPN